MKNHQRKQKPIISLPNRPRLCISKSNQHIYAQVINDIERKTLCACSTLTREIKLQLTNTRTCTCIAAKLVGKKIAKLCVQQGIQSVVFDRRNKPYHGKIKAVADAAREVGLNF
uniref:Large ribosomal subunit protein uL18c n=1 Tax=Hildenbrandia rivularis TaxID=135206 RepID=A0A1C9CFS8_9FLOR|nr:ribosomal protein L18 [Hildenbrandia rivularis]AOM67229.1 ribosomal protein L18 [Hildenbrandia rivularis]